VTVDLVVRDGELVRLPPDREGNPTHTVLTVYVEMLAQCMRHYHVLPDTRSIEMHEIRVFYRQLVPELRRATAPKG
jgi:hypothetical protein